MYKSVYLEQHIREIYARLKAGVVANRDNKQLTPEEGAAINDEIVDILKAEFLADRPCVNPDSIVSAYGAIVPSLKRLTKRNCKKLTGSTKAEREELRKDAALKYAEGLVRSQGYNPILEEDLPASRQEQAVYYAMDDFKDLYADCFRKMKDDYYKNDDKTPEEIAREKAVAKDTKNRLSFKMIKDMIAKRGELYNNPLDDAALIKEFPQIAADCHLLNEAVFLLGQIKKELPAGITAKQVDELMEQAYNMSAAGTLYTKRMAMLADPFYPEINLEEMYKLSPEKAEEVADVALDMQRSDHPLHISQKNNILGIPGDVGFAMQPMFEAQITKHIGGTMSDVRRGKIFCDKEGNVLNMYHYEITQALKDHDGELYIIDKDGKHDPVPVVIDDTAKGFKILVGDAAVTARANELQDPELTRWERFCNWTHKFFHRGEESDTKKAHDAQLERNARMRERSANQAPEAVRTLAQEAVNRSNLLNKPETRAQRDRIVNNLLNGFKHIPLDNPQAFDYALASLLANKALNEKDGIFKDTMHRALGAYNSDFNEERAIGLGMGLKDQFREFAWRLRRDEQLMNKLRSGNKAQATEALDYIIKRFVTDFDAKDPWKEKVSKQFKEYIAEADKKYGNTVDVANGKVICETDEKKLKDEFNNDIFWKNIRALYGPNRQARLDWMPETSCNNVYSMDEFIQLKKNDEKLDIKLEDLSKNCNGLDEDTFASLCMMVSLKQPKEYMIERNGKKGSIPDTTSFEDVVIGNTPRPNIRCVFNTIVEPTREKFVNDLKNFKGEGRAELAKKLAESLKLFVLHASKFGWGSRNNCTLTQVADNVMNFIDKNGMMEEVMKNGLDKKDLSFIKTTLALGKAADEGFNAEAQLKLEANGDKNTKLTDKQRLDCINKVMRLKVIQADNELMEKGFSKRPPLPVKRDDETADEFNKRLRDYSLELAYKDNEYKAKYSDLAKDVEQGAKAADRLAEGLLPAHEREKLAAKGRKGSKEFFNKVLKNLKYSRDLADEWKKNIGNRNEIVRDVKTTENSRKMNDKRLMAL